MNFFDAQDQARRSTRWLVIVYVAGTVLIVAGVTLIVAAAFFAAGESAQTIDSSLLITTALVTGLFIVGATIYKTAHLSSGGGRVASDMGGTLVSSEVRDPRRRRLRNVVEEIAIASGVPVPEVYVLEEEMGINAFAAGYAPGDAAIAVTRGTLDILDRDELQGVIAHEFSHILNGDMRLNIRMMGVLFGIMVLGLIGRMILRGLQRSRGRGGRGAAAALVIGLGFTVLGWIGVFFARLVKAAVSRQREYLADASAVQFTRQTDGIANALKKIGGYARHSYIESADPEEISHMLFAGGASRLTAWFATHPPLTDRIQALDPAFTEGDYPVIDEQFRAALEPAGGRAAGFVSGDRFPAPASIPDAVARPDSHQIALAGQLRRTIPAELYDAAHDTDLAWLLTLALALNGDATHAERQLGFVDEQLGTQRGEIVRRHFAELGKIGEAFRLPLLEIAFPALRRRPRAQLEYLLELVGRLVELDGEVDLYEYCFRRVLSRSLAQAEDPTGRAKASRASKRAVRFAAVDLLQAVAHYGHPEPERAASAFRVGIAEFGEWASDTALDPRRMPTLQSLDRSLDVLARMNTAGKKTLLQALGKIIGHDGKLSLRESELLRAICASLDCPLPPLAGRGSTD